MAKKYWFIDQNSATRCDSHNDAYSAFSESKENVKVVCLELNNKDLGPTNFTAIDYYLIVDIIRKHGFKHTVI